MATASKTSVNTSSTAIIAASNNRSGFTLHNPGAETLWCALGEAAVVGEGFPVLAGTTVMMKYEGEFNTPPTRFASYNLAVNGIYATETNNVAYQTL